MKPSAKPKASSVRDMRYGRRGGGWAADDLTPEERLEAIREAAKDRKTTPPPDLTLF